MNRREAAQEPSMEEILASIRKIIADEPAAIVPPLPLPPAANVSALPSNRFQQGMNGATAPAATPSSSLSARLNDVFGTPGTDARPAASSRSLAARTAVDDDLGDLLADGPSLANPLPPAKSPSPRPAPTVIAAAPMRPVTMSPPESPFASMPPMTAPAARTEAPKSEPVVIAAMPLPSTRAMNYSAVAPVPAGPPTAGQAAAPLREPTHSQPATNSGVSHLAPRPAQASRPINFSAVAPVVSNAAPAAVPPAPDEPAVAVQSVVSESAPNRPEPIPAAVPPAVIVADRESSPVPVASAPSPDVSPRQNTVTPSVAGSITIAGLSKPERVRDTALEPSSSIDRADDAVASALGALAAGLAASARAPSPEIIVSAVEVVLQPAASQPAAPARGGGSTASRSISVFTSPDSFVDGVALTPVTTRTLDDTAAELLRPMLRQWLDDNMPRIVEKALSIEMAKAPEPPVPADKSK